MSRESDKSSMHFVAEHGKMQDPILGGRVFVLSARSWIEMQRTLYDILNPPTTRALLWHIGKRYGIALARRAKEYSSDVEKAAEILADMATQSGWGYVELVGNLAKAGELVIEVEDCVFCIGFRDSQETECKFLEGVLTGIIEDLYGGGYTVGEVKCMARNNEKCIFVVRPK